MFDDNIMLNEEKICSHTDRAVLEDSEGSVCCTDVFAAQMYHTIRFLFILLKLEIFYSD